MIILLFTFIQNSFIFSAIASYFIYRRRNRANQNQARTTSEGEQSIDPWTHLSPIQKRIFSVGAQMRRLEKVFVFWKWKQNRMNVWIFSLKMNTMLLANNLVNCKAITNSKSGTGWSSNEKFKIYVKTENSLLSESWMN